jgi:outer membrane protein OmpA-like peptidoglycan-associated protein
MTFLKYGKVTTAKEEHWIPLSDLMTGLMMMFMLVAIVFMVKVEAEAAVTNELKAKAEEQASRIKQIAILYDDMRSALYKALDDEFRKDLKDWGADLDPDLTIRFREPDVLFDTSRAELKTRFKQILDDFFPRYVKILGSTEYKDSIEEVRIEGHTSSFWKDAKDEDDAYFKNMELSQQRTRTTLEYVLSKTRIFGFKRWIQSLLTANGLSSSKLRLNANKTENIAASQRVEFRVRTNADARIAQILTASQK